MADLNLEQAKLLHQRANKSFNFDRIVALVFLIMGIFFSPLGMIAAGLFFFLAAFDIIRANALERYIDEKS